MRLFTFVILSAVMTASAATLALARSEPRQELDYSAVFEDAVEARREAQIAGTYPERSEVLVKLPNNNQYAVPVAPGSDLSVWRTNEVVEVTIAEGLVTRIGNVPGAAPGYTYTVLNGTDVMAGIPEDLVVRTITLTTEILAANPATGAITFVSPTGYERTAVLSNPAMLAGVTLRKGEMVEITYFEAVDIRKR